MESYCRNNRVKSETASLDKREILCKIYFKIYYQFGENGKQLKLSATTFCRKTKLPSHVEVFKKECGLNASIITGTLSQLSGRIGWTYELFKIYGWYPGQKYLKTNKNSLKNKWFIHALFWKWPICSFPMSSHMENKDFLIKYEFFSFILQ